MIPAGKVYLSPVIDCFDGLVVSWSIGTRPDAELVNTMLDSAIESVAGCKERPVVHSDRGAHYRWPGWLSRIEAARLTRSMSRKGCSPDNAACEGFFGRLKTELFYPRDWRATTIDQFIEIVDSYIRWYNAKRIKVSLGSLSPSNTGRVLESRHKSVQDFSRTPHTVYGTTFAALGRPLDPITQDAAAFFEDHVVIKDEAGAVAVEEKAGLSVADYFKGVKAAIHQNHGLLTVSRHSIEAAAFWFIALERCCQQQLLVEATGIKPIMVPEHSSRYSRDNVGSEYIGWLHFQPIYEQLVQTSPDMFD